ncbi:MAG: flagellar basal-body rod protein FlgG [Spirochaetes bacterium]|nr:flagellar basal-body rod protein FlgG [Spirochaetota bacterium]
MMRSLWTAATGMIGQQFHIDTISNNLSNVNTTGFKKNRADFEDLLYHNLKIAGTPATNVTVVPTGVEVGHGVKVSATQKMFAQGSLKQTENPFDMAIEGEGFFKVRLIDGTEAYTRDGAFKVDSNGQFVNSNGYFLDPEIILPEGFIRSDVSISEDGRVFTKVAGSDEIIEVGQINITRFVNPAGLKAIGGSLFKTTMASGDPIEGPPSYEGLGKVHQGFLEMSNVNLVDEMVDMIVAQRAYEVNSKSVTTSDSMLATAIAMKR